MQSPYEPGPLTDLLFQSSLDGVLAFDVECRYTHWNPAMERLTGIAATEVRGKVAFEIFPFLREIGEDLYFRRALAGESAVSEGRSFHVASTGKTGHFEGHYSPVRDAGGGIVGGMAIIRDITDRIGREADQRFRALVEQAPFSVQIYAKDGLCTYVNPAWERFWGSRREDTWDYNVRKDPQAKDPVLGRLVERAFQGESITLPDLDYDPAAIGKVGRRRWIRAHYFPVQSATGELVEIAQVTEDITDTKALERSREDLLKAFESAQEAIRARDAFLAIASHELKTPVTLMKMQTQLATRQFARNEWSPERYLTTVRKIDGSIDRLAKLVEQILDVARIQSGRFTLERESVDLGALASEVADRFQPQFDEAGIRFTIDVADPAIGSWDRHRLDQVVTNLLSNAIHYAPGAPVTVRTGSRGERAFLEVRDGGPGIPASERARVFDRFERVVSSKHVGGLGLGLHIVHEIIVAHGGKIDVDSPQGGGARFMIELPKS